MKQSILLFQASGNDELLGETVHPSFPGVVSGEIEHPSFSGEMRAVPFPKISSGYTTKYGR